MPTPLSTPPPPPTRRYFAGVHHLVPAVLQQLGIGTTDLPYVDAQGVACKFVWGETAAFTNMEIGEPRFCTQIPYSVQLLQL